MNKRKGSISVNNVIEWAIGISIILGAIGTFIVKLAKADYIRRSDPNGKKKNDHSGE
ncbi:hypothetical protein OIT44_06395 [Weissella ceti]|uniref:Uncharacterized protein n=1 Tax=Weissella ceti TaxID=759620 RepID=A0ABT3E629_9LACO|nr:hypothetical protein [Weissella ceti]MCW0953687.1 hypothetical protein [Weissella ceti]QVK12233.1 hypothetical protein KHQ31_00845 [Weissella ceti]